MLIEFCCPVCLSPLAVEPNVAGGQVNCPKCLKLILIPEKTPLERHGDTSPYHHAESHHGDAVAKAIGLSVEPYRRELETKSGLLNDAVEMIKTRNQRIKEIESLILNTQKELWEMEVLHEDPHAENARAMEQLQEARDLAEENGTGSGPEPEAADSVAERVQELENEVGELGAVKEELKNRLSHLSDHAHALQSELTEYEALHHDLAPLHGLFGDLTAWMASQDAHAQELADALGESRALLAKTLGTLQALQEALQRAREQAKASSQELAKVLADRDTWRTRAEELGTELESLHLRAGSETEEITRRHETLQEQFHHQETLLEESLRTQQDLRDELGRAQDARRELENTIAGLRQHAETEQHALQIRAEDEKSALLSESAKREAALEKKLKELRMARSEQEERLESALRSQQELAEQSLRAEKQRSDLQRRLDDALDRLEAAGISPE